MLKHSLLPFLFFPLVIAATWAGGSWPLAYIVFAVLAYIVVDNFTPPLEGVPDKKHETANDLFLFLQLPLSAVLLLVLVSKLGVDSTLTQTLSDVLALPVTGFASLAQALGTSVVVGIHLGSSTVVAHELMHRQSRLSNACSRLLLIMNGDGQFQEAHLYGHHANVGTPRDPATARSGEWVYKFIVRSTMGQWLEAYAIENRRLRAHGLLGKLIRHRVLRANLATLALLALVWWSFGALAGIAYLVVMATAKSILETINYIQHYGLVREQGSKVEPKHSWDCRGRGSSLYLFNLTRHAEHHIRPKKPFWDLINHDDAPLLPHGYMLSIVIALLPPIWFSYIGARLKVAHERSGSHLEPAVATNTRHIADR